MYIMEKRATGADKARKHIHTAGEALVPTFADGVVRVQTKRSATVHALRRKGWRVVEHTSAPAPAPKAAPAAPAAPPPAPPAPAEQPERWHELKAMTVKKLRSMARDYGIKGRSGMNEDELIAAIMEAEA